MTPRMMPLMDRLRIAARMILVLVIAISVIMPNYARAMPMQSGSTMTGVMMSSGCNGHGCGDHQSGNPVKAKATGCAVAVCTAQVAVTPDRLATSTVSFYSMRHKVIAEALPAGAFQAPDPYPPRQLSLI